MEHNTVMSLCLCRPSAVRLNLILMRDGESYIALNKDDPARISPASVYKYRSSQSEQTDLHRGDQIKPEEEGLA